MNCNAHVLAYYLDRWRRAGLLALATRGAERDLHNKNKQHWGQLYVDEYPNVLDGPVPPLEASHDSDKQSAWNTAADFWIDEMLPPIL